GGNGCASPEAPIPPGRLRWLPSAGRVCRGAAVNNFSLQRIWGEATAFFYRTRRISWIDLLVLVALFGFVFGLVNLGGEWTASQARDTKGTEFDLPPGSLPLYPFFPFSGGLIAYALSLVFPLVYGSWGAKDNVADGVLVPTRNTLQSIPVLG